MTRRAEKQTKNSKGKDHESLLLVRFCTIYPNVLLGAVWMEPLPHTLEDSGSVAVCRQVIVAISVSGRENNPLQGSSFDNETFMSSDGLFTFIGMGKNSYQANVNL
ncbi:hypothetical protein CDAR_501601 [Caerostris darwini]|uniref:Uncharacterized protein n=1 Tax=Caerostris darwini TaxID=1538125 RepID=A0AAV4PRT5_9ARAC|nr:hypothetical protein CDAR_501601 [Caerostris darwini]